MPLSSPGPASLLQSCPRHTLLSLSPARPRPGSPASPVPPGEPHFSCKVLHTRLLPQPHRSIIHGLGGRARYPGPDPAWGPRFRVGGSCSGRRCLHQPHSWVILGKLSNVQSGTVSTSGKPGPLLGEPTSLSPSGCAGSWPWAPQDLPSLLRPQDLFCCCNTRDLVAACGIQFPDQGSNPAPWHSEFGVLTAGPPGKSPSSDLLKASSPCWN